MGLNETGLSKVYFENAGYSCPKNTVYNVSAPMHTVWDKNRLELPPLTDSFEQKSAPKTKSETTKSQKKKPANKDEITKTVNFMGKPTDMTGKVVHGTDGTYTYYLADDKGNLCIMDYDKDGNILKIQQEKITGNKYQCISSEIDPKTNVTRTASVYKDLKTGKQSEYSEHTDAEGRKLSEQTLEKEDGKETATFRQFDKNGDETSVTETVTEGSISTISSAERDAENGVIKSQESVYNSDTNEETCNISEYTETESGEQIVTREEKSTLKGGIRTSEATRYDDDGNPVSTTTSKYYPDGSADIKTARINSDDTVTESSETHNNKTGYINKYTTKKDGNGNLLFENAYLKENGITSQEFVNYNTKGEETRHVRSESGKGVFVREENFINENGQPDFLKTMILNGEKYTDEAEFQKDLDKHLKK